MSIAKVIEVLAQGETIEAAVDSAVAEAGETVRNIRSVYVDDLQAIVRNGSVDHYRVNAKITFVVGADDNLG